MNCLLLEVASVLALADGVGRHQRGPLVGLAAGSGAVVVEAWL